MVVFNIGDRNTVNMVAWNLVTPNMVVWNLVTPNMVYRNAYFHSKPTQLKGGTSIEPRTIESTVHSDTHYTTAPMFGTEINNDII